MEFFNNVRRQKMQPRASARQLELIGRFAHQRVAKNVGRLRIHGGIVCMCAFKLWRIVDAGQACTATLNA